MVFKNVEHVLEEHDPVSSNKRLADGWTLLAIVPGGISAGAFMMPECTANCVVVSRI